MSKALIEVKGDVALVMRIELSVYAGPDGWACVATAGGEAFPEAFCCARGSVDDNGAQDALNALYQRVYGQILDAIRASEDRERGR